MYLARRSPMRGMTLIDVVVGTALIVVVFSGLFALLRASVLLSSLIESETAAAAVANNQMEYIRSLPYASVGTVGGIPAGSIPQNATTTVDGAPFGVRTFIEYYDDPSDGTGSGDTNGITTDYKRIKITVTYPANHSYKQLSVVSNYAPPGLETTVNGGTLQIVVVNASGAPVPGATVQITNASTSPTVNLTTFTDSTGYVSLPGAATSTQYAVTVTKNGYSTAQTYLRTTTNQNPTPGYLTVAKNQTTTATFAIDLLSTLTLNTFTAVATSTFSDTFTNGSKLASASNVVTGSGMQLSGGAGNFALSGSAVSTQVAPTNLVSWGVASTTLTTPAGTSAVFHVVDGSGNLLPDTVLAGNAAGFTGSVNLYRVSTSTYPSLALSASLQTSSANTTPVIQQWGMSYTSGPVPLGTVSYTLTGAKTVGSTGAGAPIYKTTVNGTTNSGGTSSQTLEWDAYSVAVSGYDVVDACAAPPYALSPGGSLAGSLILGARTTNGLLVSVTDSTGTIVPGASVTVSGGGYNKTVTSSSCGNAYFSSVPTGSSYSVTLTKTGYTTTTANNVSVSGSTFYAASF